MGQFDQRRTNARVGELDGNIEQGAQHLVRSINYRSTGFCLLAPLLQLNQAVDQVNRPCTFDRRASRSLTGCRLSRNCLCCSWIDSSANPSNVVRSTGNAVLSLTHAGQARGNQVKARHGTTSIVKRWVKTPTLIQAQKASIGHLHRSFQTSGVTSRYAATAVALALSRRGTRPSKGALISCCKVARFSSGRLISAST